MPDNGIYSGSFSGSFQGDGSNLVFGGTSIVSSSAQLSSIFISKLGDDAISGSTQVEFNDINNNPFTQGATSVVTAKHIVPANLNLDLGSVASPFRDLYLSSASLYVDGTQIISSNTNELVITTDSNQSLKLVEEGADTVQIQTENGDITLTSTGNGNIELDAPIQIVAGNQILSSDGNAIQFGEDIDVDGDLNVQGDITLTGNVDGVDVAALKGDVDAILSGSSADRDSFAEIVSLINSVDTGNDEAFAAHYTSSRQRLDSIEGFTSSIDTTIKTKLTAEDVISGSSQVVLESADKTGFTGASSITTLGTIGTGVWQGSIIDSQYLDADPLPAGTISGSSQVDVTQTTNYGLINQYSDTKVKTKLDSEGVISGSSQITITESQISDLQHYTNTDWDNRLSTKTTTDLDEGTNLYFTNDRVISALPSGTVSGSSQITITESQISDLQDYVTTTSVQALDSTNAIELSGNNLRINKASGQYEEVDLSQFLDNNTLTAEQVEDIVGAMVSGNTESGITVTYQDADGTIDFAVASQTDNNFTNALKSKLDGIADNANNYSLPTATDSVLGGVIIGSGISIASGVISANSQTDNNFTNALKAKLDGIEAGATADQTSEEIQDIVGAMVSGNTESGITVTYQDEDGTLDFVVATQSDNNFTDALLSKLNGIEDGADVVNAASVNAAGAVMNSDSSTAEMSFVIDEDDMASNTATKVPTQQSVKTYVDSEVAKLVDSAPGALDTLNELAAALGDDANFASTVTTELATKANKSITITGSNGIVGGGDLSANRVLSLNGNYTGTWAVTGDITATGDVVAYASSDERLKKNIEIISKPIEKVKALKGVTWVWKDEASDAQKMTPGLGVIAQDVEKVLPQLVDTRENGYKAVDYGKLTGLLIEAIKDQQKQIDDLKSRLQ
jgi:hypothetical protein